MFTHQLGIAQRLRRQWDRAWAFRSCWSRFLVVSLFLVATVFGRAGASHSLLASLFDGQLKGRNLLIPIYASNQAPPVATLRIERVATGYQKRGLFRVGVLPMLVLEGVRLEVHQTDGVGEALERLARQVETAARPRPIELRELKVTVTGERAAELYAAVLRCGTRRNWSLEGLGWEMGPHKQASIPRLTLRWEGPGDPVLIGEDGQAVLHLRDIPRLIKSSVESVTSHENKSAFSGARSPD